MTIEQENLRIKLCTLMELMKTLTPYIHWQEIINCTMAIEALDHATPAQLEGTINYARKTLFEAWRAFDGYAKLRMN